MCKRAISAVLFFCLFALAMGAEQLKCDVCGKVITGAYFYKDDLAVGGRKNLCPDCAKIEARCFACDMPVKEGYTMLPDGRYLCARDAKAAISSEDDAKAICQSVNDDLNRLFARYITFPDTNALVSIVNKFYLENLFKNPGAGQACVSIYGATTSNPLPGHKIVHSIAILSYLRKSRLMAVYAHEITHAWMGENVSRERTAALDKDTLEAFCELVAYKYMASQQETFEMESITKNTYTKGKINVLIAADNRYGFDAVVEWIKSGDDTTLDLNNLDRVRAVAGAYVRSEPSASALFELPVAARPVAAPTTLVLKSISGTDQHRFALINSTTFEVMEKEKVRVGQTNYLVQCLEIGPDSVTIQVNGSPDKKHLALRDSD
jgi:hypothetical protein